MIFLVNVQSSSSKNKILDNNYYVMIVTNLLWGLEGFPNSGAS